MSASDPAFPRADGGYSPTQTGMTLRQYYAGVAMQGLLANGLLQQALERDFPDSVGLRRINAEAARLQADALIAELEGK